MKKHHTTIVLLTLFFTGLIVLWWANYVDIPTNQELEANRNLVLPKLAKIPLTEIQRLTIDQPRAKAEAKDEAAAPAKLVFMRKGDSWQMVEPIDAAADSPRIELLLQGLKNLTKSPDAGTILEPGAKFGLDPAVASIQLFSHNFEIPVASIEVGKAFRDQLYVRPDGSKGIEVVEGRFFHGIEDQALGWRERSLFHLATFQVGGLTITGPQRDLEAERVAGKWQLTRPFRTLGDNDKVEGVLSELTSLRVADGEAGFVADNVRDRARYGLDQENAVRVELRPALANSKPQRVLIGKAVPAQEGKFYAMQEGQDDVVMVNSRGLNDVGVDPNALRSSRVTDFDPARASFLRIEALGRQFAISRTEQGWSLVQPVRGPADHQLVETLLTELNKLETSEYFRPEKISEPELSPPAVTIRLWQLNPGERLSKEPLEAPTGEPKVSLNLGRHDVLRKSVYAQLPGDPSILALPDVFLDTLPKNELAYRERSLLNLNLGQVTRLTVERDREPIVLYVPNAKAPNQWRMERPVDAPANIETVTKALTMLTSLRAQQLITDKPTQLKPFGLDRPSMTITWVASSDSTSEPSTQSLKIGARVPKSESWYAMLSDSPLLFVLSDAVVLPFRAEFRSPRIITFRPREVERLTLRWPDRSLSFVHHATPRGGVFDWEPAPGTQLGQFDLSRIHSLATDLSKLTTRVFIQHTGPFPEASGLTKPQLTVEYTLKGEKAPHSLRVGQRFEEGEYYATTAEGDNGTVFALGGSGWADLLRVATPRTSSELPENVFAPMTAPKPEPK